MTKIILGPEHDAELRQRVMAVVRRMGATVVDGDWAVAGSQEIETVVLQVRGNAITIEAETYIGLSISGEDAIVNDIAARVGQQA